MQGNDRFRMGAGARRQTPRFRITQTGAGEQRNQLGQSTQRITAAFRPRKGQSRRLCRH